MADALASGASVRKDVGVQVPPRAPTSRGILNHHTTNVIYVLLRQNDQRFYYRRVPTEPSDLFCDQINVYTSKTTG